MQITFRQVISVLKLSVSVKGSSCCWSHSKHSLRDRVYIPPHPQHTVEVALVLSYPIGRQKQNQRPELSNRKKKRIFEWHSFSGPFEVYV